MKCLQVLQLKIPLETKIMLLKVNSVSKFRRNNLYSNISNSSQGIKNFNNHIINAISWANEVMHHITSYGAQHFLKQFHVSYFIGAFRSKLDRIYYSHFTCEKRRGADLGFSWNCVASNSSWNPGSCILSRASLFPKWVHTQSEFLFCASQFCSEWRAPSSFKDF